MSNQEDSQSLITTEENSPEVSKARWPILDGSKVAVVPLPIFWIILSLLIGAIGIGIWFFSQLQQERKETALLIIQSTATVEWRQTATTEAREQIAASATVAQSEVELVRTVTAERAATGTAERIATLSSKATTISQQIATATAEHGATVAVEATLAAKQAATATAQRVATTVARQTATAEQRATGTAAWNATRAVLATTESVERVTATAERIATLNIQATATAEKRATATAEARITATPTPSPTPVPKLNVIILGCDTGIDVLNGLLEVTNAWVTIQNVGQAEASNVNITLSANDEQGNHPDKREFLTALPPDRQITFKLTVGTQVRVSSKAVVDVTTEQGISSTEIIQKWIDYFVLHPQISAGRINRRLR